MQSLLVTVEAVFEKLDVELRVEPLPDGSAGGLVRVRERRILMVPRGATDSERLDLYVAALRRLDTSDVWLPPAIRARL